jgi:single-strand DNA-binding protein
MAGWEQTIIVGNVGRDPELRYTQQGIPVCDFSVAVTRRLGRSDEAERREKTTWYRVTCWRQQAEIAAQYVRKGTQIMVVGTVEASAYQDKSGQPAASLNLTANNFQLLGSRDGGGSGGERGGGYDDFAPPPDDVGDIPF